MGQLFSIFLGVGNRPRQGRAVLELAALAYVWIKIGQATKLKTIIASHVANRNMNNDTSALSTPSPSPSSASTSSSSSSAALVVAPQSMLQRWNAYLSQFTSLQLVLGMLILFHASNNLSLLLGLNAPHASMYRSPDMHYTHSFANVRWLLTALDAATLSTMKVKFGPLRHAITAFLSVYYLFHSRMAENQVDEFRRSMKAESIKACWEKGTTPILALVDRMMRKRCTIDLELLTIPSPDGHQIECRLFYPHDRSKLAAEQRMVLHIGGGGFIAMKPVNHADYVSYWADQLGCVVLSVDYRKAPQYPFPCGFEDSWYVYKAIVESNGSIVGINSGAHRSSEPIRIAIVGDSAGGNLASGVTIRAINEGIRTPNGIHLIYPILDMAGEVWKSSTLPPRDTVIRAREHKVRTVVTVSDDNKVTDAAPSTALTTTSSSSIAFPAAGSSASSSSSAFVSADDNFVVPQLSSRTLYAFDGVLPMKYMLLIADCYFRNGGDPVNNPYASPMAVSDSVLARFPPMYAHVGSVDPLSDDMLRFAHRAALVNTNNAVRLCVIPGVSHAYLHVVAFLPAAKTAVDLSAEWLRRILDIPMNREKQKVLRSEMKELGMVVQNIKAVVVVEEVKDGGQDSAKAQAPMPMLARAAKL